MIDLVCGYWRIELDPALIAADPRDLTRDPHLGGLEDQLFA